MALSKVPTLLLQLSQLLQLPQPLQLQYLNRCDYSTSTIATTVPQPLQLQYLNSTLTIATTSTIATLQYLNLCNCSISTIATTSPKALRLQYLNHCNYYYINHYYCNCLNHGWRICRFFCVFFTIIPFVLHPQPVGHDKRAHRVVVLLLCLKSQAGLGWEVERELSSNMKPQKNYLLYRSCRPDRGLRNLTQT